MNLIEQAEADLEQIFSETGWPIKIKNPEGRVEDFEAILDDISEIIDPDTGAPVSGRLVQATVQTSKLLAKDFKIPRNVSTKDKKPWLLFFTSLNTKDYNFKVIRSNPDRQGGMTTVFMEVYKGKAC